MSRLAYRPVLSRSLRLIGYSLLWDGELCPSAAWVSGATPGPGADDRPEVLGERLRQALTRLIEGGDASRPLDSPTRYWLGASPAVIRRLAREEPGALDVGIVWVLPAASLAETAIRNDVQRALDRGHRLGATVVPSAFESDEADDDAAAPAVPGPAVASVAGAAIGQIDPRSVDGRVDPAFDAVLGRFESLHVLGLDSAAFAALGLPKGRLAALRRSGARLHVITGPGGPSGAFADAQEGFAPPLQAGDSKGASPTYGLVLKALQMTQSNAPAARIEDTLRTDPVLTFRLLRYANAAAFRGPERIEHLAHAINRVGYRQFGRWLALGLVTSQVERGGTTSLINQAVVRALVLEALAVRDGDPTVRDQAFITGLFSMLDAIVGQPLPGLVAAAMVSDEVKAALIDRSGPLSERLAVVEGIEAGTVAAGSAPVTDAAGEVAAGKVTATGSEPGPTEYALLEAVARAPTLV